MKKGDTEYKPIGFSLPCGIFSHHKCYKKYWKTAGERKVDKAWKISGGIDKVALSLSWTVSRNIRDSKTDWRDSIRPMKVGFYTKGSPEF